MPDTSRPATPSPRDSDKIGGNSPKLGTRQDENGVLQSDELSPALRAFLVEQRRAALTQARSIEKLLGLVSEESRLKDENVQLRQEVARLRRLTI